MTVDIQEKLKTMGANVQGYSGYRAMEDRQDTMDVFNAYLEGRLVKRVKSFEKQLAIWEQSPEFIELAAAMDELMVTLQDIMVRIKDDMEKIKPFCEEYYILEEDIARDLVCMDEKILEVEAVFSKMTEEIDSINVEGLQETKQLATKLQFLVHARSRRVFTLNRIYTLIQGFIERFAEQVTQVSLDSKMFDQIDLLLNQYPQRLQSFESILKILNENAAVYQELAAGDATADKWPAFELYRERFPRLVDALQTFLKDFTPRCDVEKEALGRIKDMLQKLPDFEKLNEATPSEPASQSGPSSE